MRAATFSRGYSKRDGLDHFGAVVKLANELGMKVPSFNNDPPEVQADKDAGQGLLKLAVDWYHHNLVEGDGKEQREYLVGRGFSTAGVVAVAVGRSAGRECAVGVFQDAGR
jgi:DNA primase